MINDKQTESNTTHPVITREALAQLGDGPLAYVKTIRSEDVARLFPQAPKIAPGIKLFSLHAADGIFRQVNRNQPIQRTRMVLKCSGGLCARLHHHCRCWD